MLYLTVKALLSGVIIAAASELAARYPSLGALVTALPLVTILAMIWLWRDTGDLGRVAAYSQATFWFVLPTLPMLLVLPALLGRGFSFWSALGLAILLTLALYLITMRLLPRLGIAI